MSTVKAPRTVVRDIPIDRIERNEGQPREEFDAVKLRELAESIREFGLQQPITVRETGRNRFEIVMGERRWRACQLAGLERIPAIVRRFDGDDAEERVFLAAVAENVNRADMTLMEEARAYHRIRKEFGYEVDRIARLYGKSVLHIELRLAFMQLCPEAVDALDKGLIGKDFAFYVARLQPGNQRVALARYVRGEFADQHAARAFAEGLKNAEDLGPGFFEIQQATEEQRQTRQAAMRKAKDEVDAVERAVVALAALKLKSPDELAGLFAGEVGAQLERIETVHRALTGLRRTLKKAKGISEARTYAVREEAVPG
ncbi:ParB/RepB/Spo0J family partition protein [Streptomyces yaizuensis]|uniref:ParB/RepB/Spo0J family partition protein n=1 Tax=Streptomyces yaizuensis TaxID=2989713 RepID=A0AA86J3P8_9ACTN|nr:ParB/RepB/Spo0J family partition protein [Streptomyces sp. YSPA8]BDT39507.1 ParB/RepB/Spo0J family partition protein [Streptomyces sp. YSPA8]